MHVYNTMRLKVRLSNPRQCRPALLQQNECSVLHCNCTCPTVEESILKSFSRSIDSDIAPCYEVHATYLEVSKSSVSILASPQKPGSRLCLHCSEHWPGLLLHLVWPYLTQQT